MKKIMFLAAVLLTFGISKAKADDDRPITVTQLPATAQQFIKKHFPQQKVAYAKIERDFLDTTYDVVFTDSSKLEFFKDGQWKEVDCRHTAVPAAIVPQQIRDFVTKNYPGVLITKIDRDKRDYELKISNGLELTFDLKFNLIEIDD